MARVYLVVFLIIFIFLYIRYLEHKSIFFPVRQLEATPENIGLKFEEVIFDTEDGKQIHGWFIPADGADKILIFCHGNAGNISHRLEKIDLFHRLGINILIFDYRGYGKSKGISSEIGLYRDTHSSYNYVRDKKGFPPENIIVFGESLGSVAAVDLASSEAVGGLITEGIFTNAKDMGRRIYPFIPAFFYSVRMDSLSKIKRVYCPKLIMHSINDEVIPFELAKKVFENAPPPKKFVQLEGAHNTTFIDSREKYTFSIASFLSSLEETRSKGKE